MFGTQNLTLKMKTLQLIFRGKFKQKNKKVIFSSHSVATKVHEGSISCEKYDFSINTFHKINFWPILKNLLHKIDFLHFPLFDILEEALRYTLLTLFTLIMLFQLLLNRRMYACSVGFRTLLEIAVELLSKILGVYRLEWVEWVTVHNY